MPYINNNYLLSLCLSEGDTNLYPTAKIYWSGFRKIDQSPKNLSHISGGLYSNYGFIPSTSGFYSIHYYVYTGSNRITLSTEYGKSTEIAFIENSQIPNLSSQIRNVGFDTNFVSSQMYWVSSNAVESWSLAGSSQAAHLMTESNYISSQIHSISSQNSPADIWGYANRTLTDDTGVVDYISSQIHHISSNLESYGGGGASSYNIYTRNKSPWNADKVKKIIQDVEETKEKLDGFTKTSDSNYKQELNKLIDIVNRLDKMVISIENKTDVKELKESLQLAKDKIENIKIPSSEEELKGLDKNINVIVKMLSSKVSDEDLQTLADKYDS